MPTDTQSPPHVSSQVSPQSAASPDETPTDYAIAAADGEDTTVCFDRPRPEADALPMTSRPTASRPTMMVLSSAPPAVDRSLDAGFDVVRPSSLQTGLDALRDRAIDGVCVATESQPSTRLGSLMLECGGVLEQVPDGYCLVDLDERVLWSNAAFRRLVIGCGAAFDSPDDITARIDAGARFDDLFVCYQFVDAQASAFSAALGTSETARTTICTSTGHYLEIQVTPLCEAAGESGAAGRLIGRCDPVSDEPVAAEELPSYLLATVRDVTDTVSQRRKLEAIDEAGLVLGDLAPEDILDMEVESRIDLLKEKIAYYIDNLLEYETVEIRLLDEDTGELRPLLAIGMTDEAEHRQLYSAPEGQGVTGYVAATGHNYRCDDIASDPLYLQGGAGACSSLTVPLVQHDEVIGTFNVESRECNAFSDRDLTALRRFGGEVAAALNTLELLEIEKTATTSTSVERILCGVADPLDKILINTSWMIDQYIGHDQPIADRLRSILTDARSIRRTIQESGETPACGSLPTSYPKPAGPPEAQALRGKRILVVDEDPSVRMAAHELLGRYGANVETSRNGTDAATMAKSFHYDTALIDINLPDMSGSECFVRLREISEETPLILMTGFGYDPGHSIVKARRMGLQAVLFKPFRLDQLLTEVGKAVSGLGGLPIITD